MLYRIIIILIVIYLIFWLFSKYVKYKLNSFLKNLFNQSGVNKDERVDDIMVQDPVCKTYLPKEEAIHIRKNGIDLYFCSKECKDIFLKKMD